MRDDPNRNLWKPLPRRKKLMQHSGPDFEHPPQMTVVSFKPSRFRVIGRFFLFLLAGVEFGLIWLSGKIRRKHRQEAEEAQAIALRKTLQHLGGTFIKLGQQLSIRADLLPYAFCRELSALLDDVAPFDSSWAALAIKEACGKELSDIFLAFDPQPIGSASIACVFQATLKMGRRVAVKVRRPGIGELFAADFRVLDCVASVLEFLTILRPGFTEGIRKGIRDTVMEEMDFRREARYQELFRRSAKRKGKNFIKAPRVYPEYSSEKVLVMDLVTKGLKLSELLAAVDQPAGHPEIVQIMESLRVEPGLVARRLLWANYSGMTTDMFFHGDPSPGNIFVQKKSRLMFIDFGSCGAFNESQRRALRQINHRQALGDPQGMAVASLALLEPLPPIDIDAFREELEGLYRLSLYAMQSKHAKWWERTTAVQWYHFLGAALRFKVPLPPVVIRMARATLLYDTVAARLDPKIVFYDEYRRYERFANRMIGKEVRERLEEQLEKGPDDSHFAVLENVMRTGNRVIYRLERLLDLQPFKFISDIDKGAYAVLSFLKMSLVIALITLSALLGAEIVATIRSHRLYFDVHLALQFLESPWYLGIIGLIALHTIRNILFRLGDRDIFKE